jgi:hypothetical protein
MMELLHGLKEDKPKGEKNNERYFNETAT